MNRFLMLIVLAGVALIAVAWYRNWLVVDTERPSETGDGSTQIHIKIDPKKAREDVGGFVGGSTLQGEITAVNAEGHEFMLRSGEVTHQVRVGPQTALRRGSEATTLESLQIGERASVRLKDEKSHEAVSVEVPAN